MEIDEGESSIPIGLTESMKNELEGIIVVLENHNVLIVPEHIKRFNPEVYKPWLISIGPVFHGQSELQPMEAFEKRYAGNFIESYNLKIQELIDITTEHEQMLCDAYGMESSQITTDELVKVMIINGAFLVEFLLRHKRGTFEEMDRMSHKKWNTFKCDLFLLENQIPYSYLHILLDLVKQKNKLSFRYLNVLLLNFLDEAVLPQFVAGCHFSLRNDRQPEHLLDLLAIGMQYKEFERSWPKTSSSASCPTISQLHRAGIKFRAKISWYHATIDLKRGILAIPRFTINENTRRYFANLLALELYKEKDRYATDYIALMDYLIDGPEDVKILVQNGILQNFLDDDKAAADFVNDIGRSIEVHPNFLYSGLVEDLNAHCKKVWIKWKSTYIFEWKRDLKRNYFSNPWKTLSVFAAVLLIGLTVAQTVFSYLQLKSQ